MKSAVDMERFAAIVERYTTPLLEDSMGNEKEGYEMNTKHTPRPWCAIHLDITAGTPIKSLAYVRCLEHDAIDKESAKHFVGIHEAIANAALIVAAPDMATELARGRAALCALRYWVPEDLLPAVNAVIVNMAHTIVKATGGCPPEADGRTEETAHAAIEEAAK